MTEPAAREQGVGTRPEAGVQQSGPAQLREFARAHAPEDSHDGSVQRALGMADIVEELGADPDIVAAAILYPLIHDGLCSAEEAEQHFGERAARLARELIRLGDFGLPSTWDPRDGLATDQAEVLRKMLLAIVEDVRVVVIRLAEQLYRLNTLKRAPEPDRRELALETREIYAPLASRLGIWQLKWQLEDLAFRFLEPEIYHRIASKLQERRTDRESYIEQVKNRLREELGKVGVAAEITGRPKHIYSIWKKMQRKDVEFEDVFDIRAVRVLVDSISDCYAALGVVHSLWPYVPGEFDDYIATPKDNLYRSLHTAVIGPGGQALEIQIRTHEMHEHAELGIAAHWQYKEGGSKSPAFEEKIRWLRQVLEPTQTDETERDFIDRIKSELFEDRVYAMSPMGDVVDMPKGATPIDFAYHVHTEVGHHCRGAKVNGRMVPLTYQINNGDRVEIITARNAHPSRDWLIPQQGYLASARSRAKVRNWFRRADQEQNRKHGRAMLEREFARLGIRDVPMDELLRTIKLSRTEQLYQGVGSGDISLTSVTGALQRMSVAADELVPQRHERPEARQRRSASLVSVEGVGDLLSSFARCCRPVPSEPIAGYITQGRGVSIHRQNCANLLRLQDKERDRIIAVEWSRGAEEKFPVEIAIHAYDRRGLVRDVSAAVADARMSILAMNTRTDPTTNTADLDVTVAIGGLEELSQILNRIASLPNVLNARRKTN